MRTQSLASIGGNGDQCLRRSLGNCRVGTNEFYPTARKPYPVYETGLPEGRLSPTSAVGLFLSVANAKRRSVPIGVSHRCYNVRQTRSLPMSNKSSPPGEVTEERFKEAVSVLLRTPPKHKKSKGRAAKRKNKKPAPKKARAKSERLWQRLRKRAEAKLSPSEEPLRFSLIL